MWSRLTGGQAHAQWIQPEWLPEARVERDCGRRCESCEVTLHERGAVPPSSVPRAASLNGEIGVVMDVMTGTVWCSESVLWSVAVSAGGAQGRGSEVEA